jgi:hypothetical protein
MRDFGFGTRSASLENLMQQEIQDMVDVLNGKKQDKVGMLFAFTIVASGLL